MTTPHSSLFTVIEVDRRPVSRETQFVSFAWPTTNTRPWKMSSVRNTISISFSPHSTSALPENLLQICIHALQFLKHSKIQVLQWKINEMKIQNICRKQIIIYRFVRSELEWQILLWFQLRQLSLGPVAFFSLTPSFWYLPFSIARLYFIYGREGRSGQRVFFSTRMTNSIIGERRAYYVVLLRNVFNWNIRLVP